MENGEAADGTIHHYIMTGFGWSDYEYIIQESGYRE